MRLIYHFCLTFGLLLTLDVVQLPVTLFLVGPFSILSARLGLNEYQIRIQVLRASYLAFFSWLAVFPAQLASQKISTNNWPPIFFTPVQCTHRWPQPRLTWVGCCQVKWSFYIHFECMTTYSHLNNCICIDFFFRTNCVNFLGLEM